MISENTIKVYPLEASLLLRDINLGVNFLLNIRRISRCCDFEICGIIAKNKQYFLQNWADDKLNFFKIQPSRYFSFFSEISCVFHSHVYGPAVLSSVDLDYAADSLLPQVIYSRKNDDFLFYNPNNEKQFIFSLKGV